jgi:hypothetical protein
MILNGPTPEDKQKIHSEVNQIVNQRLLLTTLAVTIFGVMVAWIIPRPPPEQTTLFGGFIYITAVLLVVVLFALFLLSHHLNILLPIWHEVTAKEVYDYSAWLANIKAADWSDGEEEVVRKLHREIMKE